jgi:hypothetical protein
MSQPVFDQKQAHVQLRIDALAALMEGQVATPPTVKSVPDTVGGVKPSTSSVSPSFLPGLDPTGEVAVIKTGAPEVIATVTRSTWPFRVTCDEPAVDVRVDATGLTEAAMAYVQEYVLAEGTTLTVTYQDAGDPPHNVRGPFRFPRRAQFEVQEESGRLTVSEPSFERDVIAEHMVGRELRADERRYLLGPIIVDHLGSAWELPGWLRYEAIPRARIAQVVCEAQVELAEYDRMASLEEAVAVLYTAGLSRPLNAEAAEAYIWAAAQVLPRYHMAESPLDILAKIYGPDDAERCVEMREYAQREVLDRIRRDTRGYVIKHQKQREK